MDSVRENKAASGKKWGKQHGIINDLKFNHGAVKGEGNGHVHRLSGALLCTRRRSKREQRHPGNTLYDDIYTNWDGSGLMHIIHAIRPHENRDKLLFPVPGNGDKPSLLFTGCLLEEEGATDLIPVALKLSFKKETEEEVGGLQAGTKRTKVDGDGMIHANHFEASGCATQLGEEPFGYHLELRLVEDS